MTRHDPRRTGAERSGRDEHQGTSPVRHDGASEAPPRRTPLTPRLDFCTAGTAVLDFLATRERVWPCGRDHLEDGPHRGRSRRTVELTGVAELDAVALVELLARPASAALAGRAGRAGRGPPVTVDRPLSYDEVYARGGASASARRQPDEWEPPARDDPDPAPPPARYRATRLADVTAERVEWLWPGRLPRGKLVVLDGDPSVGKSTVTLDLVARVTTGRPMPGEQLVTVPPSDVVLLAAEDGLADTIRPRLDAAGADCARVHHLDAVPTTDEEGVVRLRPPVIPGDADAIEALVVATGAVLVIVDVLMAYLDGRSNSYRDQDVRGALAPLVAVAERTEATIVVLRHLTKAPGGAAIYRGGGSIGIIGAARAALLAAIDPDDDTGTRRVLAPTKSNLGPPAPAMGYQLVTDDDRGCARVEWLGATAHTADALVAAPATDDERGALDDAVDWLRSMLAKGPRPRAELGRLARGEGIADRTLARARERTGVVANRDEHAHGRPSMWALPDGAEHPR